LSLPYKFIEKQLQRIGLRSVELSRPPSRIRPEAPFWALGDIHGCSDLLNQLLRQMNNDPVIFVGDLVDRGPNSREVLRRVFDLCSGNAEKFVSLMGNHEKLLLDFLNDPERVGPSWVRIGGLQTLASFGIPLSGTAPSETACRDARDALMEQLGEPMTDWLAALPFAWSSGNIHVVHAGADPSIPMAEQDPRHLTWGHRDFERVDRTDGQWVVHGHVIVPKPTKAHGRIAIDTGAYATGVLTAAHVSMDAVEFLST
jgi:serine/threonine protein phosphatase 1